MRGSAILIFLAATLLLSPSPSYGQSEQNSQAASTANCVSSAKKRVWEKMNSIIIDKFNFILPYDLTEIIPYLTKLSKELDPEHVGIKFVLRGPYQPPVPPASAPTHREIPPLAGVSFLDVLETICAGTNHDWKIEDGIVIIFPLPPKAQTNP